MNANEYLASKIEEYLSLHLGEKNDKDRLTFNGKTYLLYEKMGEGAFSEVYRAVERFTGKLYAVKIIDKSKLKDPQDANREIQMMKSMDHPNIIKFYGALEIWGKNGENSIYLFMEYLLPGAGDLHYLFKKIDIVSENRAKKLFRQIVSGVEYLHSKGMAHRDLKPSNILIDLNITVKIADFGDNNAEMESRSGTRKYVAPEVVLGNAGKNNFKADMYSLGIILRDLVTNFGKKEMSSADCKTLYEKLTSKDPSSRPTATEVLKDKWLVKEFDGCHIQ